MQKETDKEFIDRLLSHIGDFQQTLDSMQDCLEASWTDWADENPELCEQVSKVKGFTFFRKENE